MTGFDDWVESLDVKRAGVPRGLTPHWFEGVYRDRGPISADELWALADIDSTAHLASTATDRLNLAGQLLTRVLADAATVGLARPEVQLGLDEWNALTISILFTPAGGSPVGGNCNGTSSADDEPELVLAWLAERLLTPSTVEN